MSVGEQLSLMLTSLANKSLHSQHTHCVWQVYRDTCTGFLARHACVKRFVWPYPN